MENINKKYKYIQIGIASPEDIITWANPVLQGKKFTYDPKRNKKVTYIDENGNTVEYTLRGEVTKPETINYRTQKPERNGLFCEVIFGPEKDNQCACGKKKTAESHSVCQNCGVEITKKVVRRERMGYIALNTPVVHIWYLRNTPSKIATLLDEKTKDIEDLVYLNSCVITEVAPNLTEEEQQELRIGRILPRLEVQNLKRKYLFKFKALSGAEAIKHMLKQIDVKELAARLREEIKEKSKQAREKLIKRLEIAEAFAQSDNKPEWMVMDVIPVIPPDLRPMVPLDGGRFATTDLNDLYRKVIGRNERLRKFLDIRAPETILANEKRLVQLAVDALFDNSKTKKPVTEKNRVVKSLSEALRGKQGRFRQNLLGKRVDYSGRSVIVIGPDLKMYQCGIPREMALILFKPFIMNYLMKKNEQNHSEDGLPIVPTSKDIKVGMNQAKQLIEKGAPEAMEALEKVIVEHPVLLNRAPTLHRLSVQAFEPKLVEGKAIRLHPLVTTAFNADFDGDQMPVHVPLSEEAKTEARLLMLASKNILAPKDGKPIVTPSQDMIIGNYYLTIERSQIEREYSTFEEVFDAYKKYIISFNSHIVVNGEETYRDFGALKRAVEEGKAPSVAKFTVPAREGKAFRNPSEVELAYEKGDIDLHTRFVLPARSLGKSFVHLDKDAPDYEKMLAKNEELSNKYIITTYGKIIQNQVYPENFPYVNEPEKSNLTHGTSEKFFVNRGENYREYIKNLKPTSPFKKGFLSDIISEVFKRAKLAETSNTLDKMKDIGFQYSTIFGLTVSAFDVMEITEKKEIIDTAQETVNKYKKEYKRGTITNSERRGNVIKVWTKAKDDIENIIDKVMKKHATVNDIFLMADSKARGSKSNFTQLAGMRGLMRKPNGEEMEIPVKACFREGMKMSEFFLSTHGARKGSTDTALKTAESGYLTRRLVDVSQDVIVTCDDCGTDKGMLFSTIYKEKDPDKPLVKLEERIVGRYTAKPVYGRDAHNRKVLLAEKGQFITEELADKIKAHGIQSVWVRTLLTCDAKVGVCVKCYGSDLSTTDIVEKGEVVGIVAAQSIGEPGTQLTMRTFHSGGVAAGDDITQGLPRIQELFEARLPKGKGIISEIKGTVKSIEPYGDNRFKVVVDSPLGEDNKKTYITDSNKPPVVKVGQEINAGDLISKGLIHPKELLRVANTVAVENYILKEVQNVYRNQGVDICDKHVEIIIKQMLQKVLVIEEGDTNLLPGTLISKPEILKIITDCVEKGIRVPVVKPVLLGITRASLKSDSFLSAASFQETTRVLTEAAIRGKIDTLDGLKENIIIGGLIPAGTGLVNKVEYDKASPDQEEYPADLL